MTDTPEVIVNKPKPTGQRKIVALVITLVALLAGLIAILLQSDPTKFINAYMAFAGAVGVAAGSFMAGNAIEHKAGGMTSAVSAAKALAGLLAKPDPKPPVAP